MSLKETQGGRSEGWSFRIEVVQQAQLVMFQLGPKAAALACSRAWLTLMAWPKPQLLACILVKFLHQVVGTAWWVVKEV